MVDPSASLNFASLSLDCARFQALCDREIKIFPGDPEVAAHCVLWHGPMGSKSLRPAETRTHILDAAKVTSDLRFQVNGKQVSARVYAYVMTHSKETIETALHGRTRMRLSSSCKNYRCVNPWHHSIKTLSGRVSKVQSSVLASYPQAAPAKRPKKSTVWCEFTVTDKT